MRRTIRSCAASVFGMSVLFAAVAAAPALAKDDNPGHGNKGETFHAHLKGYEEVPSVSTEASGDLTLKINDAAGTIAYNLSYENLQGTVTQSHIHFGQKSVAGSIVIWLCQTAAAPAPAAAGTVPTCPDSASSPVTVSGTVTAANVIAASTASQQIAAGELAEVIAAIRAGVAYGNVHSSLSPGGEIRGQLR